MICKRFNNLERCRRLAVSKHWLTIRKLFFPPQSCTSFNYWLRTFLLYFFSLASSKRVVNSSTSHGAALKHSNIKYGQYVAVRSHSSHILMLLELYFVAFFHSVHTAKFRPGRGKKLEEWSFTMHKIITFNVTRSADEKKLLSSWNVFETKSERFQGSALLDFLIIYFITV